MKSLLFAGNEKRQTKIYQELFAKYAGSHKSLHWSSRKLQLLRFDQLIRVGDLNGKRILDIGSGLGDFYLYLKNRSIDVDFTGYDLVPEFVDFAQNCYSDAKFEVRNILTDPPSSGEFDYIFASGIFAFATRLVFVELNKKAFDLAKNAWVFNFFRSHRNDTKFLDLSFDEIVKIAKNLEPKSIKYESGYIPNDTTFYIYK